MKWVAIIVFGLSVIFSLVFGVKAYINHAIETGSAKVVCESALTSQNEAIEKSSLKSRELEYYNKNAYKQEREVIEKYKIVHVRDRTCEAELKEIRNALSIFYANPP